jgi:hypothetical protein
VTARATGSTTTRAISPQAPSVQLAAVPIEYHVSASPLISPISWTRHWVWVVPLLIALVVLAGTALALARER